MSTIFAELDPLGGIAWFWSADVRPCIFAGILFPGWRSVRKVKDGETTDDLFAFLTTDANADVAPIHPRAMPVILDNPREWEHWLPRLGQALVRFSGHFRRACSQLKCGRFHADMLQCRFPRGTMFAICSHMEPTHKPWPRYTPTDFRHRMERVLSYRTLGAADVWGEVREWLEERGVAPPDDLPEYEPRR